MRLPGLGLVHGLEEVLEGDVLLALLLGLTAPEGALVGKLAGLALVGEHAELVAGVGHRVQALDLDGLGGADLLHTLTVLAEHGTHAAVRQAGHHGVAHMQGAALHEHGGHGAAAAASALPRHR